MSVSTARDRRVWATAGLLGAMVVGACAATATGASDANLARARSVASTGADVYARECAECHGQRGEGLGNAPAIMGPGALPEFPRDQTATGSPRTTDPQELQIRQLTRPQGAPTRDPFRTAQDVYRYVSVYMPMGRSRAGQLKPEQYWAAITYILLANGAKVPDSGINESNASTIPVQGP
jgi:mono/diheme cytochrome c family protein